MDIKGFGYARKSPDEKEDTKTSIDNQITLIKKTFKENGWVLVKIFIDENISGYDRTRKEFLSMIKELYESPDVSIIGVKEQDRFCRDSSFFTDVLKAFQLREKKLYSCMQKKFLSHDDLGDSVRALMDGNYIYDQKKKAELVLEQKQESGKPTFRPPFGYKSNFKFNPSGSKIPIDKSKKIFDWILNKKDAEIVLSVISDYVNKRDYRVILKEYKITKGKYYRIIKNANNGLYSGFIYYVRKFRDDEKVVIRTEEIKYKSDHPHLISPELFNKINGGDKMAEEETETTETTEEKEEF